jgi:uncharacterized protein
MTSSALSPCLKICIMDAASDLCAGCGRTRHEIGMWSSLDNQDRARIMLELPERMKQAALGKAASTSRSA